jgi:hypothetical protein
LTWINAFSQNGPYKKQVVLRAQAWWRGNLPLRG